MSGTNGMGHIYEIVYEYDCGHYARTYIDKTQHMVQKNNLPITAKCSECVRVGRDGIRIDAFVKVVDILDHKQMLRDKQLKRLGI
jgi:Ethanolamine utilization protein EutJ (predicted chaperonin)